MRDPLRLLPPEHLVKLLLRRAPRKVRPLHPVQQLPHRNHVLTQTRQLAMQRKAQTHRQPEQLPKQRLERDQRQPLPKRPQKLHYPTIHPFLVEPQRVLRVRVKPRDRPRITVGIRRPAPRGHRCIHSIRPIIHIHAKIPLRLHRLVPLHIVHPRRPLPRRNRRVMVVVTMMVVLLMTVATYPAHTSHSAHARRRIRSAQLLTPTLHRL